MLKRTRNLKLKAISALLLIALMSLRLNPFMINATKSQLQFYSLGLLTPATDSACNENVFYSNATLDGETAYSIDYGKILPSGTMSYYKELSMQGVAVLEFGYPNVSADSMGCTSNDEAYIATQMALWMIMMETGETESLKTFNIDNICAKSGYEESMQRTINAAKNLYAVATANSDISEPSVTLNTENAKIINENSEAITGPYEINVVGGTVSSITVSLENAPSSARIVDGNGNETTTFKNGDLVYVKFNEKEEGSTMTLNVLADTNKLVGSVYSSDTTSQNFVKLDSIPLELSASVNIKWETQTGNIEILRIDENNNPIEGAKFELKNSDGIKMAEGITDAEGYVRFSEVKVGTYKLVEVSVPEGNIIKNSELDITVNFAQTFKTEIKSEKVMGAFEITKLDENEKPMANVTFEILDENNLKIAEIITNESGNARIDNLNLGKYYYKEKSESQDVTLNEFCITATDMIVKNIISENDTIKNNDMDASINKVQLRSFSIAKRNLIVLPDDADNITINNGSTFVSQDTNSSSKVIVRYIDENGNEIIEKEIIEGKSGDKYSTQLKYIEGYEISKKEPINKSGTMKGGVTEVIYEYRFIQVNTSDINVGIYVIISIVAILGIVNVIGFMQKSSKKESNNI